MSHIGQLYNVYKFSSQSAPSTPLLYSIRINDAAFLTPPPALARLSSPDIVRFVYLPDGMRDLLRFELAPSQNMAADAELVERGEGEYAIRQLPILFTVMRRRDEDRPPRNPVEYIVKATYDTIRDAERCEALIPIPNERRTLLVPANVLIFRKAVDQNQEPTASISIDDSHRCVFTLLRTTGGRRRSSKPSKKRLTALRRRSSNARKVSKSRKARATRRK